MQRVFRSIVWIAIIILAALLVYFVMKLLTLDDPGINQPASAPINENFTISPLSNSDRAVPIQTPQPIEPISLISNINNRASVNNDEVQLEESEQSVRKTVLAESQSRLNQLMQDPSSITTKEVEEILEDMSVLKDDNGLVGGVDLDALINTLRISDEIQTLAQEIQVESELGENANPNKLMEQSHKMEKLQNELLKESDYMKLLPGS